METKINSPFNSLKMLEEDLKEIIDTSEEIWSGDIFDPAECDVNQSTAQLGNYCNGGLGVSNRIPIVSPPINRIFSPDVNRKSKGECLSRQSTDDFINTRDLFGTSPEILSMNFNVDDKPSAFSPYNQTGSVCIKNFDNFITNEQLCKKSGAKMEYPNVNTFLNISDALSRHEFDRSRPINDICSNFDWRASVNQNNDDNDIKMRSNIIHDTPSLGDSKMNNNACYIERPYNATELLNGFPEDLSDYLQDSNAGEMFQELLLDFQANALPELDVNANMNPFYDESFTDTKPIYPSYDQHYKVLPYVEASTNTTDTFMLNFKETSSTSTNRSVQVKPIAVSSQHLGCDYDVDRDREKRKRNNEASRKSRAERKFRFKLCEEKVDRLKLENNRLRNLLHDIDKAIEEAKGSLVTKS